MAMLTPLPYIPVGLITRVYIVIQNLGVYSRSEVVAIAQEATTMGAERLMLYQIRFSVTTGDAFNRLLLKITQDEAG